MSRKGISVDEAVAAIVAAAPEPRRHMRVLAKAHGRTLIDDIIASRAQPPFASSAMDGYAVVTREGVLKIVGESQAGRRFAGKLSAGQAVRIFTGAPVPDEATAVVMQENVVRTGDSLTVLPDGLAARRSHVRPAGLDFKAGDVLLKAGQRLDAWALSLAAAAGCGEVAVARRPRVAVLSTGNELVPPGEMPGEDQIWESCSYAVMAMVERWGGKARYLGAANDSEKAILKALKSAEADLIVTIGGASVGDHDLVRPALERLGLVMDFAGVNVRPGRPTWFGRLADGQAILGLPGNPASAAVCAELFLQPFLASAQGYVSPPRVNAVLLADTPADGPREAWLRAVLTIDKEGRLGVKPFMDQDSSLIQVFAQSGALIRIPPGAEALPAGKVVDIIVLDRL